MSKNFRETLNEQLRDPAFQAEWETLEPERQIIRAIIEGRERCDLTQQQLAEITGIQQADISHGKPAGADPPFAPAGGHCPDPLRFPGATDHNQGVCPGAFWPA